VPIHFSHLVVAIYVGVSGVLLLYAANAYYLIWACLSTRNRLRQRNALDGHCGLEAFRKGEGWPLVTTQVPLFNEIAVAERVINAVAAMDYPAERHEIQILDDSTDETCALVDAVTAKWRSRGIRVEVIRRTDRTGYKAGALAEGMARCQGELIAIFDADFVPPTDFLRRTVPHLVARPDAGWVQARWGHLNEEHSILTKAQGIGIDGHFAIDQIARGGTEGFFMNFNGTAGVWRKAAIADAGGWTADTLTEDLDLSYRAQLRGWRGIYLPELVVPGELPADASAFKSQQFRWAKGSVQTAIKLAPTLFRSDASLMAKLQGWFHLTHYAIHPFILLFALLSLPLALLLPFGWEGWGVANVLIAGLSFAPSVFYATGQCLLHEKWTVRLLRLPFLILAGIGLALSNSVAVYEAVSGKRSPFLRTPKQGQSLCRRYRAEVSVPLLGELVAGIASLAAFLFAAANGRALAAQFLLLTGASFLFFAVSSAATRLRHRKSRLDVHNYGNGIKQSGKPSDRYESPIENVT
jgi:cellulose synthase/poly-beta-1,6-N-acetylglucosamine synthase-like glycosyltransferase